MSESQSRPKMSVLNGRMSHLCAVIGSHMFMVGGYHKGEGEERFKDRDISVHLSDINIYSIRDATWRKVKATGDIPNRGSGMCMASNKQYIYAFGGLIINDSGMREFSNTVHELDTNTMSWKLLKPVSGGTLPGVPDRPSIRDKAAMVYYKGALWVFAGWGTRIDRTQHNSRFVPDQSHEFVGWNNELWRFDIQTRKWNSPPCTGTAPSPRAAHTLTMFSDNRAMLFGGRTREGRVSELYILNLDTLAWEGPLETGPGPEARSLHTCTRLHDDNVLLLGGMNGNGDSVQAQWVLVTGPNPKWKRVELCKEKLCARTWHTTAAYTVSEHCSELLVFGGSPDNIWQPKHKYWANMVRFTYGVRPLYEMCLDYISQSETEQPQNEDMVTDIRSRKRVLEAASCSFVDSVPIYDMSSIGPTSAS